MIASTTSLNNQLGTKPTPAEKAEVKLAKEISDDSEVSNSQTISGSNKNIRPPLARCRMETQAAAGMR